MNHQAPVQRLSRRLLSNYLLFGLLSVVSLAVGLLAILDSAPQQDAERSLLARINALAPELIRSLRDGDAAALQTDVESLASENRLILCAVIDADGRIVSHTSVGFVGQRSGIEFSASQVPGVMERVSYLREDGVGAREYWIPLRDDGGAYGMLQVSVPVGNPTSALTSALTQNAGIALALPVVLLIVGGSRLRGVSRSSSVIGQQLAELAADRSLRFEDLRPVEELSQEATGWNRLVAAMTQTERFGDLEGRLAEVLGGFREERYEQILQSLTDGVAVSGEDGHITFANEAFARLLDRPLAEILGEPLLTLLPENGPDNAAQVAELMEQPSRPGVMELRRSDELADGVLRLARAPLLSRQGEVRTQLWSLRDITQQKLVEHTRDQFVDTATHELRTPLSTIRGCAEALQQRDSLDEETQKHFVNTINAESTRLGRFVDEFLNISRMEAGSLTLNRHETNLEKLLREVADKVQPSFDLKQIRFSVKLPPKLPELRIDKDKVAAALANLLGNAEKYTPAGGEVKLLVEVVSEEFRIHVEDSGIGIAQDDLPRIFNKFFRSSDARVREITGTGLGLPFSREVIRLHGGDLTATSQPDRGSRFTLTLPNVGA